MALRSRPTRSSFRRTGGGVGSGGVDQIIAGVNITISPTSGIGIVTINATGGSASWPEANPRVYAVDGVNGDDTFAGFADAASPSGADYSAACAAAGLVAKKTIAGLAAIFPAIGAGRMVIILIAAGTYTDDMGLVLGGVEGYLSGCPLVRGTVTDATAGSVAFAGDTADETMAGGVTATGMNAAGYNPAGAPSSSQFQCLKVGGAAPAFGAEPAVPLGWRVRFDSATATAALRNQCRQVCQVSGTDTVRVQTVFPAVPVAGDVFYLEMGGVVIPAFNYSAPPNGQLGSQFAGIRSAGQWGLQFADAHFAFCGAASLVAPQQTTNQLTTSQSFTNPILGTITPGGGFRSEAAATVNGGQSNLAGLVSVTSTAFTSPQQVAWGPGCAARNVNLVAGRLSQGTDTTTPANFGTALAAGIPHTFGDDGVGAVQVDGSDLTFQQMTIIGAAGAPCIQLRGKNSVVFAGVVNGSAGNGDVGMDLQNSQGSSIQILSTAAPTVTGASGDIRWAGVAFDVWTNFQFQDQYDTASNHIYQVGVNAGPYKTAITPSVSIGVNNSGAPIGSFSLVAQTGASLQFKPASATDKVYGVVGNGVGNGTNALVGSASGFRLVNFDAAPTLGSLVYVSAVTAGLATVTNPGNQSPLGIVVSTAFAGNLAVVHFGTGLGGVGGAAGSPANWPVANMRVYAIDGAAGNDANKGFADPVSASQADFQTASAAAGAVALQTFAGLAKIFPREGDGRQVCIIIAAGTYVGGLDVFLAGVDGYVDGCPLVRGTSTNATAASVAFSSSDGDRTFIGCVTATGMNAPGYNPTGAATTTSLPCLKVGGAAPGFTPSSLAIPMGLRIRFDSATATAALQNQCVPVAEITAANTLVPSLPLNAVPGITDVFYLEQPGVICAGYTLDGENLAGPAILVGVPTGTQVNGIASTGTVRVSAGLKTFAMCTAAAFQSGGGINAPATAFGSQTSPFYNDPFNTWFCGGGLRVTGNVNYYSGNFKQQYSLVSTGTIFVQLAAGLNYIDGSACSRLLIEKSALGAVLSSFIGSDSDLGASGPFVQGPIIQGTGGVGVNASSLRFGEMKIQGLGAVPAIRVRGCSQIIFTSVVSGTTGNTDVGMDLTSARGSTIILNVQPTVTGTAGDVRLAGGQIVTWAQAFATGITDSAGNRIIAVAKGSLSITQFAGSVIGAAGAVVSYLADTGPAAVNQIVALRRPTSLRLATRLRVTNLVNTSANAVTVTLYKNAVPTAMQVSIPAATAANTKFSDTAHPILFLDGDDYDLRMDDAADVAGVVSVSAALEWAV